MRLKLGVIVGAVGVRGDVRARLFTLLPERLVTFKTLGNLEGTQQWQVVRSSVVQAPGQAGRPSADMTARLSLAGVTTRTMAEALKGQFLCVDRLELPALDEEEFYHADLVGCAAVTLAGEMLGRIVAVENFGAQDNLLVRSHSQNDTKADVLAPSQGLIMIPFTHAAVPQVDLMRRVVHVETAFVITSKDAQEGRNLKVKKDHGS